MSRILFALLIWILLPGSAIADPVIEHGGLEDFVFAVPDPDSGSAEAVISDLEVTLDEPAAETGTENPGAATGRRPRKARTAKPAPPRAGQAEEPNPVRDLLRYMVNVSREERGPAPPPPGGRRDATAVAPEFQMGIPGAETVTRGVADLISLVLQPEMGEAGLVTFSLAGINGFSLMLSPGRQNLLFSLDEFGSLSWQGSAGISSPVASQISGPAGAAMGVPGDASGGTGEQGSRAEVQGQQLLQRLVDAVLNFVTDPLTLLLVILALGGRFVWQTAAARG